MLQKSGENREIADYDFSIVVPCFNEESCIYELYERVKGALKESDLTWALIFIDDGSTDHTLQKIKEMNSRDRRVHYLSLSRNFGKQSALLAGIEHAPGKFLITMDSDLQHPPALIPQFIEKWKNGAEVVIGKRKETKNLSFFKCATSRFYSSFFSALAGIQLEPGLSDFQLLDRKVVNALLAFTEHDLHLRLIIRTTGFRRDYVDYIANERFSGTTKFTLKELLILGYRSLISFSTLPLRLNFLFATIFSLVFVFYGVYALYAKLVLRNSISGWTSLMLIVCFIGFFQFIMLGMMGEYISTIHRQVLKRPRYLVSRESISKTDSNVTGRDL